LLHTFHFLRHMFLFLAILVNLLGLNIIVQYRKNLFKFHEVYN